MPVPIHRPTIAAARRMHDLTCLGPIRFYMIELDFKLRHRWEMLAQDRAVERLKAASRPRFRYKRFLAHCFVVSHVG